MCEPSVRLNAMRTRHDSGSHASGWIGRLTSAKIHVGWSGCLTLE